MEGQDTFFHDGPGFTRKSCDTQATVEDRGCWPSPTSRFLLYLSGVHV